MAGEEPEEIELLRRQPDALTLTRYLARPGVEREAVALQSLLGGVAGSARRSTVRTRAASSRGENGFVT